MNILSYDVEKCCKGSNVKVEEQGRYHGDGYNSVKYIVVYREHRCSICNRILFANDK